MLDADFPKKIVINLNCRICGSKSPSEIVEKKMMIPQHVGPFSLEITAGQLIVFAIATC